MTRSLVLVANARLPSQRAQSLQVAQVAGAFARAGLATTVLHARRADTPAVTDPEALWDHYGLPRGPRPGVRAVPCLDWIDRVPRGLQYLPARAQELTFARNAAGVVERDFAGSLVLSRELETARRLVRAGRPGVFLEVHRVPGGRTRRRWLLEASRGVAGIVAISGGVREDLLALGCAPEQVCVEHDGYEARRFAELPDRVEARAALGLPAEGPLVVYTGGLLEWKGVDLLVDAARELAEVSFVIAGGMDADVEALRRRAVGLDNLRLDGFQPPERVGLYLAAGDVGVVPNRSRPAISSRYTSPLKAFEAKAAGLPLVASDLPSLREVLSEAEARFVAPDDAAALAAGLRAILADPAERAARREALLAAAPAHTWDARAARLVAWMEARAGAAGGLDLAH
jgi:glycosyltransferase involved in cell wall biosynthesis